MRDISRHGSDKSIIGQLKARINILERKLNTQDEFIASQNEYIDYLESREQEADKAIKKISYKIIELLPKMLETFNS